MATPQTAEQSTQKRDEALALHLGKNFRKFQTNVDGTPKYPSEYFYKQTPEKQKEVIDGFAKILGFPSNKGNILKFEKVAVNNQTDKELSLAFYDPSSRELARIDYDLTTNKFARIDTKKDLENADRGFDSKVEALRPAVLELASKQGGRLAAIAQEGTIKQRMVNVNEETYNSQNTVGIDHPIGRVVIPEMLKTYNLNDKPEDVQLTVSNSSYTANDGVKRGLLFSMLVNKKGEQINALVIERTADNFIVSFNKMTDQ